MAKINFKHRMIQIGVQSCYRAIKKAEKKLERYREECKHPVIEETDYMWRIGSVVKAKVCKVCGEVISTPFSEGESEMWRIQTNEIES